MSIFEYPKLFKASTQIALVFNILLFGPFVSEIGGELVAAG
jgi:hypothetical protein